MHGPHKEKITVRIIHRHTRGTEDHTVAEGISNVGFLGEPHSIYSNASGNRHDFYKTFQNEMVYLALQRVTPSYVRYRIEMEVQHTAPPPILAVLNCGLLSNAISYA